MQACLWESVRRNGIKKKKKILKKEKRKQRKKGGHDYVDMQRFEWNPEIFIGEKNNKANEI